MPKRLLTIGMTVLALGVSAYIAWWPAAQHVFLGQASPVCTGSFPYNDCRTNCTCGAGTMCQQLTGGCTPGGGTGGGVCSTFPACGACISTPGAACGQGCCDAGGVITVTRCCNGFTCQVGGLGICMPDGGATGGSGGGSSAEASSSAAPACPGSTSCMGAGACAEQGGECQNMTCSVGGATGDCCCTLSAVCGNGVPEGNEECDDGNIGSGDGCSANCLYDDTLVAATYFCGDGILSTPEVCDDANTVSGDGCSSFCVLEQSVLGKSFFCGDGMAVAPDICDDGNAVSGDGCSASWRQRHDACSCSNAFGLRWIPHLPYGG